MALDMYEPRTYLTPGYFGNLGLGFPTAMGAKVANPDRSVVNISGDGAFLFNLQELETARRYGISLVNIIVDDGGFGIVKTVQLGQFGRCKGHEFGNPDWGKLADAFGAHGFMVKNLEEVPDAVERALSLQGPSLVVAKHSTLPPFTFSARLGRLDM
ncbi:MAG: hypothetical protein HYX92_21640 [Chloroflexi bacterium]|nr:hypothetical protein [Chloroflexota bacterium]